MDNNRIKRGAVVAASAATILGLVFATPSFAATSKSVKAASSSSSSSTTTPAAPSFGGGDHKGGKGHGKGKGFDANRPAGITKTVTVDVPADGKTYKLVVTDTTVRPAPVAPSGSTTTTLPTPPKHTRVIDVTGTGSQTITINDLHPGTYSVELVAVSSSQSLTVEAPATSATPAPTVTP